MILTDTPVIKAIEAETGEGEKNHRSYCGENVRCDERIEIC